MLPRIVSSEEWFELMGIWRKEPPGVSEIEHNDNGTRRSGYPDRDAKVGRQNPARNNALR